MAYAHRGRRVAYDNIANGSVAGFENHHPAADSVSDVSAYGGVMDTGGFSNIANGALPGVEDTENGTADKLTSDAEDVEDAG